MSSPCVSKPITALKTLLSAHEEAQKTQTSLPRGRTGSHYFPPGTGYGHGYSANASSLSYTKDYLALPLDKLCKEVSKSTITWLEYHKADPTAQLSLILEELFDNDSILDMESNAVVYDAATRLVWEIMDRVSDVRVRKCICTPTLLQHLQSIQKSYQHFLSLSKKAKETHWSLANGFQKLWGRIEEGEADVPAVAHPPKALAPSMSSAPSPFKVKRLCRTKAVAKTPPVRKSTMSKLRAKFGHKNKMEIDQHVPSETNILSGMDSEMSMDTPSEMDVPLPSEMDEHVPAESASKTGGDVVEKEASSGKMDEDVPKTITPATSSPPALSARKLSLRSYRRQAEAMKEVDEKLDRVEKYRLEMKEEQFGEIDLLKYHSFRDKVGDRSTKSASRVVQEMASLNSLPLHPDGSIFVRCDSQRIDLMRVMVTGPKGTPYEGGCFVYDLMLPLDYPTSPPCVKFLTTGNGTVRFNPNLYKDGTVCLSLLGTWHSERSESWIPHRSTLLQVLVSLQSIILSPHPYFNEPGYETSYNTPYGNLASSSYNASIQEYTLQHAIKYWSDTDFSKFEVDQHFAQIAKKHFRLSQ